MADYGQTAYEIFAVLAQAEGIELRDWRELTPAAHRVWDKLEERVFEAGEYFATAEEVEIGVARKEVEKVLRGN